MQDVAERENDLPGNIAEIRRIIGQRGWCQHTLTDARGRVCIMGARAVALGILESSAVGGADLAADRTLLFLAARAGRSVEGFNDTAHDHAAVMEFLVESQLAAMNYVPGSACASPQPPYGSNVSWDALLSLRPSDSGETMAEPPD
jgi:hypothetical protein